MRAVLSVAILCAAGTVHGQGLGWRNHAEDCSRDAIELVFELSAAVESGDVNRVAALYDWNGMGALRSRRVMDQLELLSGRTLLDVVPLYPTADPDPSDMGLPPWPAELADPPPIALRVEQLHSGSSTPVSTTFSLRRRMDCWWVSL